eukprot:jgi/Bigna1/89775/estExt_fgenesh1_pg.C_550068
MEQEFCPQYTWEGSTDFQAVRGDRLHEETWKVTPAEEPHLLEGMKMLHVMRKESSGDSKREISSRTKILRFATEPNQKSVKRGMDDWEGSTKFALVPSRFDARKKIKRSLRSCLMKRRRKQGRTKRVRFSNMDTAATICSRYRSLIRGSEDSPSQSAGLSSLAVASEEMVRSQPDGREPSFCSLTVRLDNTDRVRKKKRFKECHPRSFSPKRKATITTRNNSNNVTTAAAVQNRTGISFSSRRSEVDTDGQGKEQKQEGTDSNDPGATFSTPLARKKKKSMRLFMDSTSDYSPSSPSSSSSNHLFLGKIVPTMLSPPARQRQQWRKDVATM